MRHVNIRTRLTILYCGMFLLAGAMLLGVTYLLVEASLDTGGPLHGTNSRIAALRQELRQSGVHVELSPGAATELEGLLAELNAEQERLRAETLESVLTQGAIALVAVGAVGGGFGWLLAGRALSPVQRITETARRIAGSAGRGLHERIALDGPRDEIRELADTFDTMLARLDQSFDGQRRFVANASHELRTPLALNRALVEVAVTRPGATEEVRRLGESLLAVNARHERLIEGLLTLAESESVVIERSPVDLAEAAGHVLDQLETDLEVVRDLRPAPTAGDPVLLERLVQNLVENAVRHNLPAEGWLSVATGTSQGKAVLTVANTGPVVASYEVPVLFEPFRRLGGERVAGERGFGLGLSIVRAIAMAHGGQVTATPRPEGGLVVTVTI